jgi:hypothetical protein
MQTPILSVGRLRDVMLAVVPPGQPPSAVQDRLQPTTARDGRPLEVYEDGTLLKVFGLAGRWR